MGLILHHIPHVLYSMLSFLSTLGGVLTPPTLRKAELCMWTLCMYGLYACYIRHPVDAIKVCGIF